MFFLYITNFILKENFYKALKQAKELVAFEHELMDKADAVISDSAPSKEEAVDE
jgi:flagellar biosynthesis regulator FlbT